jgi:hypothetical protein
MEGDDVFHLLFVITTASGLSFISSAKGAYSLSREIASEATIVSTPEDISDKYARQSFAQTTGKGGYTPDASLGGEMRMEGRFGNILKWTPPLWISSIAETKQWFPNLSFINLIQNKYEQPPKTYIRIEQKIR